MLLGESTSAKRKKREWQGIPSGAVLALSLPWVPRKSCRMSWTESYPQPSVLACTADDTHGNIWFICKNPGKMECTGRIVVKWAVCACGDLVVSHPPRATLFRCKMVRGPKLAGKFILWAVSDFSAGVLVLYFWLHSNSGQIIQLNQYSTKKANSATSDLLILMGWHDGVGDGDVPFDVSVDIASLY